MLGEGMMESLCQKNRMDEGMFESHAFRYHHHQNDFFFKFALYGSCVLTVISCDPLRFGKNVKENWKFVMVARTNI